MYWGTKSGLKVYRQIIYFLFGDIAGYNTSVQILYQDQSFRYAPRIVDVFALIYNMTLRLGLKYNAMQ